MDLLRVILERDPEDGFVAQCVDFDLMGIGPNEDAAIEEFIREYMRYVAASIRMGEIPFSVMRCPPEDCLARWEQARTRGEVRAHRIPDFTIMRAGHVDISRLPRNLEALVA